MPGTFMSGGRNRRPIADLKRSGQYREARHGGFRDVQAPDLGPITKPATLSEVGARKWDELAPICEGLGTLTVADVVAFATLCELAATMVLAARMKADPANLVFAVRLERQTATALRPYLESFGLTTGARARLRVSAPETPTANPLSKYTSRWPDLA